jgi:dephospho-CoA kinase
LQTFVCALTKQARKCHIGVNVGFVLFGLTGGLASGKSSVAARWKARGLPIIDADELAREIVIPGSSALQEIVLAFGPGILKKDGSLDRKRVAGKVFADPEARKKLEAITHPRIVAASLERASELESQEEPLGCYEATLLVERRLADNFRPLVVVTANERTQIARAMSRDKLSESDARARLAAQLPMKEKAAVADYVIDNNRDLASLIARADEVLDAICKRVDIDPVRYPRPKNQL